MGASCTKAGREEAAFLKAAKDGDCGAVQQAIIRDVEWACKVQTWNGQSVFHLAARYGRLDVLDTVVEAVRFNPAGPDKWKKLLRMGHSTDALLCAFVNLQDTRWQTPLHLASIYGHHEVAERLLQLGGTPWVWDELGGRTPLHYAASMGHVDVIRVVVSHNAQPPTGEALRRPNSHRTRLVDICNDSGYTPLHYAVWAGNAGSVRALTSYEASLSARNVACGSDWVVSCLKCTPLHLAAHKGNQGIVKLLLSAFVQYQPPQGADAPPVTDRRRRDPRRHVNANRQLPYHVAVARNQTHLTEMLHPDVPFSFILSPSELESRLYGVPKLAVIASKTLQAKLVADIESAVAAMAVTTARGTTASLSSGGPAVGMGRMRSGSIAALSGAVVAAATGQVTASATSAAAQQVLAAATARLRSVNERSLHGSTATLPALEASGHPSVDSVPSQQQRPASTDLVAASAEPFAAAAARPQQAPTAVGVTAPTASAVNSGIGVASGATASASMTSNGIAGKVAPSAPSDDKSLGTSRVDSERDALSLGPAPDLTTPVTQADDRGGVTPTPALPLPPAPISPFLPGPAPIAATDGAPSGTSGAQSGHIPTFNEAASAFALFAAEPFDEPANGVAGQPLQPVESASISLAVLARSRAYQAGNGPLLPSGSSNSVSISMLARGKMAVGAGSGNKIAASRSRSLRSLLAGVKNRRSNTSNVGGADSSVSVGQQQQQLLQSNHQQPRLRSRSEMPSLADLAGVGQDVLDDLDDILNAMRPPEATDEIGGAPSSIMIVDASSGAAASAAAGPVEEMASVATIPSARPSASQASSQPSRARGGSGAGVSRPFWRRLSSQAPASLTSDATPLPTPEAGSPYNGSLHAGIAALIGTAPPETLPVSSSASIGTCTNGPPVPLPPGVIESWASREFTEGAVAVATARRLPASLPMPIDSIDDDSDAALQSTSVPRPLRRSSISLAALARGGAEAVQPAPSEQEQVDGAVLSMLASLVEAPQNVLRRYRLLQLTHGLDLQDLLRDHSEQAAAAAAATATTMTAAGSARPTLLDGQTLSRTTSDARLAAGLATLITCPLLQVAGVDSRCSLVPRYPAADRVGESSIHGSAAAAATAAASAIAVASGSMGSACVGRASADAGSAPQPGAMVSPFANEANPNAAPRPSTGTGLNSAGTCPPTNAASANLAGQLLRTLSSAAASESGEGTCGVCFDQPDVLSIMRCGHRLCADCSRELCKLNTLKPALCPFCRGMIGGFKYVRRS